MKAFLQIVCSFLWLSKKIFIPPSSEGGVLESQIDPLSVKEVEANHHWDDEKR